MTELQLGFDLLRPRSWQKTETKRKFGGKLVLGDLDWRNVGRGLLPAGPRKAEVDSKGVECGGGAYRVRSWCGDV